MGTSGTKRDERRGGKYSALRENIESLAWALAIAIVIRTFVMGPFKIPSGSMRPTLIEGDRILVNKLIYRFRQPRSSDVVVFYYPPEWQDFAERITNTERSLIDRILHPSRPFIKRLVAVGGERVEIQNGSVLVDGSPVKGSSIFEENHYFNQGAYGKNNEPVEVPEGHFYVLGDNSGSSHDSRFWGFVPEDMLIGRATCIFWPPRRIRMLR